MRSGCSTRLNFHQTDEPPSLYTRRENLQESQIISNLIYVTGLPAFSQFISLSFLHIHARSQLRCRVTLLYNPTKSSCLSCSVFVSPGMFLRDHIVTLLCSSLGALVSE